NEDFAAIFKHDEINHFGNYLNSQGEICDYELGLLNFCHTSQALADLWKKDPIYGKPAYAEHIDKKQDSFVNFKLSSEFETTNMQSVKEDEMPVPWLWVESHCQICQYSLDIKKCNDLLYCTPKRAVEAAAFLGENKG
ncbi:18282_t:CDS:2, partial [Gigaspora rosea]